MKFHVTIVKGHSEEWAPILKAELIVNAESEEEAEDIAGSAARVLGLEVIESVYELA